VSVSYILTYQYELSFFFINCIIKYCCLFCWRPAVMASIGSTGSLSHFIYIFIHLYVWYCAKNKFFFFFLIRNVAGWRTLQQWWMAWMKQQPRSQDQLCRLADWQDAERWRSTWIRTLEIRRVPSWTRRRSCDAVAVAPPVRWGTPPRPRGYPRGLITPHSTVLKSDDGKMCFANCCMLKRNDIEFNKFSAG